MISTIQSSTLFQAVLIVNYILVVFAIGTIILKNSNPARTLSYILILVGVPVFGLIVYYLFGQEYRKQKIFNRKNILNQKTIKKYTQAFELNESVLEEMEEDLLNGKVKLIRLLNSCKDAPLTRCNELDVLRNGENTIPRILEDLKKATEFIHLEYYIVEDDETGMELIDAICDKAATGVSVRLIYDYVGSRFKNTTLTRMKECGVEFYPFMPVHFPKFTSKLNYRNHRKIVVIDGKVGYLGGVNISNMYYNGRNEKYWRDTHVRIEGQAVGSLQMHFFMTWDFVTGSNFMVENGHFPKCETKTRTAVQIAASGPDTDWANIMEAIFMAINLAEEYVYITTPYFIPNDEIVTSLIAAAKSGIDVRVIVPYKSDSYVAQYATASYFNHMLEGGVKVFRYKKGFVHAKTMVVDGVFSTVGTSNMDYRSFNINFEVNALVYDRKIAGTLLKHFQEDLLDCEELNKEVWEHRKFTEKLQESCMRLWAPLL